MYIMYYFLIYLVRCLTTIFKSLDKPSTHQSDALLSRFVVFYINKLLYLYDTYASIEVTHRAPWTSHSRFFPQWFLVQKN